MKRKCIVALACMLMTGLFLTTSYAGDYPGKKGKCHGASGNFFKKAHVILMNKDELGLSDAQVKQIKDLKISMKKQKIQDQAQIDLVETDIKAKMWESTIDTEAIDGLIDKKYDLKKAKAKSKVKAYATLKEILTDEQKAKLKEVCKDYKKGKY